MRHRHRITEARQTMWQKGRQEPFPGAALRLVWGGLLLGLLLPLAAARPAEASSATTESSCNFGMAKGEARQSCRVPIPDGCAVALQPGGNKPWTNISKGGNTTCRFSEKESDWKTRITGVCDRCKSVQCSARFGVMFDCSAIMPPPAVSQKPKP
jgi:hypothetical protein